ncbi:MAG: DUF3343 domain-containing protein [Bacillota bacterium]
MERALADKGGTRLCAVYPSTHQALRLDGILSEKGIPHSLIPTPRWISDACGMAVAFAPRYRERVAELSTCAGLECTGMFTVEAPAGRGTRRPASGLPLPTRASPEGPVPRQLPGDRRLVRPPGRGPGGGSG